MRRAILAYRGWALWLPVVAALAAAQIVHPDGIVGRGIQLTVTGGSAVAAWIGAGRQPAPRRFPWGCVAVGLTCSAVGDAIFVAMDLFGAAQADVSVADGFWLAAFVGLGAGLTSLIVGASGDRRVDWDGLIDIGSFAVLAVIVVMQFTVVRDLVADSSLSMSTRMVWAAYPVFDAVLLAVIVQAVVSRRLRGRSGAFLMCGVAMWLISDFALLLITDATVPTSWLNVGWMLGVASLAASAWPTSAAEPRPRTTLKVVRVTDARIVITLLPLLVPGGIDIWEFSHGRNSNPLPLFAATLALVMLAFARSTRLVTARNRQEAALERSTRYYAALAENSSDAVIVVDNDGRILNDAPNLTTMLGQTGVATTGMDVVGLLRPVDQDGARKVLDRWLSTSGVVAEAEVHGTQADGSARWFGVRAANLSNDPAVAGLVINVRDITDRKRAEQELSFSASHDSLTGLANRVLFHGRLQHALERTARTDFCVAVVYLDLDGFKMVNDNRGHEAGDRVLREVASRLTDTVRTVDTVSRLGGDEFAILIEDSPHALEEAQMIAERVLESLTAPFVLDVQQVVLSASIGIAVGDVSCTASSMLRNADVAMYRAKTTGKARWALYEPAPRTSGLEPLELANDLRQALDKRQFRLVYQPIIELVSNKIVGFEALLRWDHPTRGVIEPDAFIPIAESNGTIVAIGQWVLEEACRTAAQWQHSYPAAQLTMSVNLSARQIATPDIVEHVADALQYSGIAPHSLILEITEGVLVEDAETASRRLHQLRALEVRLAIDDFGTGYSSLSYLRQFPIDILKIDKSFTNTITDRSEIPPIVRGLLDLASTLRMKTVGEGIELDVQLDSLRDQHCELGQGFLLAKPLDVDEALTLLAQVRRAVPTPVG